MTPAMAAGTGDVAPLAVAALSSNGRRSDLRDPVAFTSHLGIRTYCLWLVGKSSSTRELRNTKAKLRQILAQAYPTQRGRRTEAYPGPKKSAARAAYVS
jgi:hypothetical protein